MKAAVLHAPNQPLTIEEVELTRPKAREVLLRTAFAGLCHSDLHFIEGLYPHPTPCVLGHESAGVVEAVGEGVTYVKPPQFVREHRGQAAARRLAPAVVEGRGTDEPVSQPLVFR